HRPLRARAPPRTRPEMSTDFRRFRGGRGLLAARERTRRAGSAGGRRTARWRWRHRRRHRGRVRSRHDRRPRMTPVRKIVIASSWEERAEAEGEILLRIGLGRGPTLAFGFGAHETTSLLLS